MFRKLDNAAPVALLKTWMRRSKNRTELRSLSDRSLRDIGLTKADILSEANKPFWIA